MSSSASVGQRFSQLIQQLGMSKNAFAMSLDKTATVIQHLVDERNKPGFDLMCKVFEVYPNVSKSWLLMGEGPMLLADDTPPAVAADSAAAEPVVMNKPLAAAATPHFPAPLFTVSTARPPAPEVATPLAEPTANALQEVVAAVPPVASPPAPAAALGTVPSAPAVTTPPASVPGPTAPPAALDAATLTAALHAQYLQHQLALAEQRNQHLLEQQQLMQQMLDLMRQNR